MSERESIESIQKNLKEIKKMARKEMASWAEKSKNLSDNDPEQLRCAKNKNYWYSFLSSIQMAHAKATKDLLEGFPEHSSVVLKGGGGR